jgi:hypothetical protein
MILTRCFLLLALLSVSLLAAGPLDDKGPPYFVDRYGLAKSSATVGKESFVHVGRGGVMLKGQFSARSFRQEDLRVEAVFFQPSLELAAVRLWLKQEWTTEQIAAALQAYGGEWKPTQNNGIVRSWQAPDGSLAIKLLNSLQIQSKTIVDAVAKELAEQDAKRKAVPTF